MITEKNNNNTSTTIQQTLVAESNILILPQKTEIMLLHQCREREKFLMRIIELLMFIAETSRLQELPSLLICRQIFMRLSALRLFLYYMTFLLRTFYAFQHSQISTALVTNIFLAMRCQNYKPLAFSKPALNFGIGCLDKKSEGIIRKNSFRKKFYIPSDF